MSDLKKYIVKRKEVDSEFAKNFEEVSKIQDW
jgi:hypothetical protein